jgi:hypothetical protein
MTFVGGGAGNYIQETAYKYVGYGEGEFQVVAPKRINVRLILGVGVVVVVLLVVVVALLLRDDPTTTTTLMTTALPFSCGSRETWTPAKQEWCCTNQGIGCTTVPPTPPPTPATTALPYNCAAGLVASWSAPQKAWCCAHGGRGCAAKKALCTLWGDPHVIGFDQPNTDKNQAYSFYGDGDFFLVKSSTTVIQGRFEGTRYTEGLAATNQIAVGGPFLHGHTIEVGTLDSGILTVDGQKVITGFPGSYSGAGFSVTYDSNGALPDVIPEGNEKRVVHMHLPLEVKVTVFQWRNYLDVQIYMPQQRGQDGVCGNFNQNQGDDTTRAIMARVGARVPAGQSILSGTAPIEWTPQMDKMMKAECAADRLAAGRAACAKYLAGVAGNAIRSCEFDYCFGNNVRARRHAKTYA